MTKKELIQLEKLDTICVKHCVSYKIEVNMQIGTKVTIAFENDVDLVFGGLDYEFQEAINKAIKALSKITEKEKTKKLWDYFKEISGSKIWPSEDPKDSPFNTIICKLCDWSWKYQAYGSFPIDDHFNQLSKMRNHLLDNHFKEI